MKLYETHIYLLFTGLLIPLEIAGTGNPAGSRKPLTLEQCIAFALQNKPFGHTAGLHR